MPTAQPDFPSSFGKHQFACPACHGSLQLHPGHITCTVCARQYPIVDGIPILIPAAAQSSSSDGQ